MKDPFGKTNMFSFHSRIQGTLASAKDRLINFTSRHFPSDMICRFTPDTRLIYVNEAYCNEFNKSREELVGKRFLDFIPPDSHDDIIQHLSKLAESLNPATYDHRVIKPGGEIRWQRWLDEPLVDSNGMLTGFQSFGRDITREKNLEEALDTSAQIMKFLMYYAADAVVVINSDKKVMFASISPAAEQFFIRNELFYGEELSKVLKNTEFKNSFFDKIEECLFEKREQRLSNTIAEDKDNCSYEVIIQPVFKSYKDICAIGVLFKYNSVGAGPKDSDHKSQILEGFDNITPFLAHEIKSPLSSIRLNIDFISNQKDQFNGNVQRCLAIINTEILRLESLTRDFLKFSSNKREFSDIAMRNLIDEVYLTVELELKAKKLKFINNVREEIISGDRIKLKSLFMELFGNSIAALDAEGMIKISSEIKGSNMLKLYFWDSGRGVIDKKNIFDPFFTTKESGTGLGLAIAQKIARFHSGDIILLNSEPGNTLFEITLPINPPVKLG